jgi:phosphoglycolate phosphatase
MKLFIFDCDGTIVDSQHVIVAAMETAFRHEGLKSPARADILGVVGLSLVPAIARLLPEPDEVRIAKRLAETYKDAFQILRRDPANHEPLYPGAREIITALAQRDGVVLGIATGKSRRGVDVLFERESLGVYFQTIQTADDHPSKPHPSMIHRALAETKRTAQNAVMIGDTTFDMEMARAARVAALGVAWGYHDVTELQAAGAWTVLNDYHALPGAIDQLFSESKLPAAQAAR